VELETRRRIAGELLLQGKKVAEVARLVGASWSAVKRWKVAVRKRGVAALASKPHPGRKPFLTKRQKRQLDRILRRGPLQAGYRTDLWTCPRIAEVIEKHFGVRYHDDHIGRLLHALGWSCQRPEHKARERDEAAIQRWRCKDWPRIKKSAAAAKTNRFHR